MTSFTLIFIFYQEKSSNPNCQILHLSLYEVEVSIFTNSQSSNNCTSAAGGKGLGNVVTGQETINLEK